MIFERGLITPLELLRIGAWKSARGLAWMSLNSEDQIERVTRETVAVVTPLRGLDVLNHDVDWDRWERSVATVLSPSTGLVSLHGVGVPMATAVLSILEPSAFPVIDRWTALAVFGTNGSTWRTVAAYRSFAEFLVAQREAFPMCVNVHQIDQAVMNLQRNGGALPFSPTVL